MQRIAFSHKRISVIVALVCATMLAVSCLLVPAEAAALEVTTCTAKSNQDSGSGIMGATPTRLTWEVQTAEGESLTEITLAFSEGTTFKPENVTVLGLDGLKRIALSPTITAQGANAVKIAFAEPTPPNLLLRVEFADALLPAEGGQVAASGTYALADGVQADLPEAPDAITVIGVTPPEQLASWLNQQPWVEAWNSNKFLHLFFDPAIIATSIPSIFHGWLSALGMVIVSFPLAIPVGLCLSFLRMAKHRIPRAIGSTYINLVRGTPLFLQMYIAWFGLPLLGINPGNFILAVAVLVLNSSAYLAEIFRAGIQSINKGQFEAARSLGMNAPQTMLYIIIPQTIQRVIPTMTSEFILMYKDTSLLAAVGVTEIMMFSKTIVATTGNVTPYIVAAGFYLIVTIPLTKLINFMEERMSGNRKKKGKKGVLPPATTDHTATVQSIRMSETFAGATPVVTDVVAQESERRARDLRAKGVEGVR
ncbi:MAG: amino acid ABC transporter permease [Raoultibacter sp.]